jgi:hypothetical protein
MKISLFYILMDKKVNIQKENENRIDENIKLILVLI